MNDFWGTRWVDTECDNRVVTVLGPGGNGVWYRYEDTGESFHCFAEDFFLWKRFVRVT